MTPTTQPDYWKNATKEEQVQALILLGALSSRQADNVQIERTAYYIALNGVTAFGLRRAMEACLQGKHGHKFFPSPAELRIQCDLVMRPIIDGVAKATRARREKEDAAAFRPIHHTAAEKARVFEVYQRFCEGMKDETKSADTELIAAKYDKNLLNQIPDAPSRFKHVGKGV